MCTEPSSPLLKNNEQFYIWTKCESQYVFRSGLKQEKDATDFVTVEWGLETRYIDETLQNFQVSARRGVGGGGGGTAVALVERVSVSS
jgi:hypothetical protein